MNLSVQSGIDPNVEQRPVRRLPRWPIIWAVALSLFVTLWLYGQPVAGWTFKVPGEFRIPLRRWIGDFMKWLVEDAGFGFFSFTDLTRFIASMIEFTSSDIPIRINKA